MKIRFLGHSCVEIIGRHHILIDPDFTRNPLPGVEFICISHAHTDHISRVAEISSGFVLASPDVCEAAEKWGVPHERLRPVQVGDQEMNIQVLDGFSATNGFLHTFFNLLVKHHLPEPAGTPLSFLVEDEASLLHIGDAHQAPVDVHPDILCLPWRTSPFRPRSYQQTLLKLTERLRPRYVLPIHYDLPGTEADPDILTESLQATILKGDGWYCFINKEIINKDGEN